MFAAVGIIVSSHAVQRLGNELPAAACPEVSTAGRRRVNPEPGGRRPEAVARHRPRPGWNSDEAARRYEETIGLWLANGRRWPLVTQGCLNIAELARRYQAWASHRFRKGGAQTTHAVRIARATGLLVTPGRRQFHRRNCAVFQAGPRRDYPDRV